MSGKINKKKLYKAVFENKTIQKIAKDETQKKIDQNKNKLISEFQNHPVTLELKGGEMAQNISGTLGGYGNLFSFIGFENGEDPTENVMELLKSMGKIKKITGKNNNFVVQVDLPSKEDFKSITRMPWEAGRSWLFDVEKSISGLGSYLYGKFYQSRSGGGIQSRVSYSNRHFFRVSYFGTMYNKFINNIK